MDPTKRIVVRCEALGLRATMRKTARWRSIIQPNDVPSRLLELARLTNESSGVDLQQLLEPFLTLVKDPITSGPITSTALSALRTFILRGVIHPGSSGLSETLESLVEAIAQCKFDSSDAQTDHRVLDNLVSLIDALIPPSQGLIAHLSDDSFIVLFDTLSAIVTHPRLPDLLKVHATQSIESLLASLIHEIQASTKSSSQNWPRLSPYIHCIRVFVGFIDPTDNQHTDSRRLLGLTLFTTALDVASPILLPAVDFSTELQYLLLDRAARHLFLLIRKLDSIHILSQALHALASLMDSLKSRLRLQLQLLLTFLTGLLVSTLPSRPKMYDLESDGELSLNSSFNGADEVSEAPNYFNSPQQVLSPETLQLVLDYLVHFSTSPQSAFPLLWLSYDCSLDCDDIFERLIGFYASGVFPSASPSSGSVSSPWSQGSKVASGAMTNVDPVQRICLDVLVGLLSGMVDRLETGDDSESDVKYPTPDQLRSIKRRKRLLLRATQLFNSKPASCLEFLQQNDLIDISNSKDLAGFLISSTSRLDKRILGEFLAKSENSELLSNFIAKIGLANKAIDEAWRDLIESFRLPGESQQIERIAEAFSKAYFNTKPAGIRSQDATFILTFSIAMLNTDLHNPSQRNKMSVTDYQRNLRGVNDNEDFPPELLNSIYENIGRREMIVPDEHAGLKGFEYAWKHLIRKADSSNSENVDILRSLQMGTETEVKFRSAYDAELLDLISNPTLEALTFALSNFDDETLLQPTITAFQHAATLATAFERPDLLDRILTRLATNTRLTTMKPKRILSSADRNGNGIVQATSNQDDDFANGVPTEMYRLQYDENSVVTLSPLSIAFGNDSKAQLAAVVLFSIASNSATSMRRSWSLIFQIFRTLFANQLLPTSVMKLEDFLGGNAPIPMKAKGKHMDDNRLQNAQGRELGLFSTLSSYLLSPYTFGNGGPSPNDANVEDDMPSFISRGDVSEKDIEATLCTVDCMAACKLDEVYSNLPTLPIDALLPAIEALSTLLRQATIDLVKPRNSALAATSTSENIDNSAPPSRTSTPIPKVTTPSKKPHTPPRAGATYHANNSTMEYDSCTVFMLEVLTSITCKVTLLKEESDETQQRNEVSKIETIAPVVLDLLFSIAENSSSFSFLFNERLATALYRTMQAFMSRTDNAKLREYVFEILKVLSNLPEPVVEFVSEQIAYGMDSLLENENSFNFFKTQEEWTLVFRLWTRTVPYEDAARKSFTQMGELVKFIDERIAYKDDNSDIVAQCRQIFVPLCLGLGTFVDVINTRERKSQDGAGEEAAIKRALEVFEVMKLLSSAVTKLINQLDVSHAKGWEELWLPVLKKHLDYIVNADRDVRSVAISSLQRCLVTDDAIADGTIDANSMVFEKLLFPILDELLRPQTLSRDASGMGETRLRASNMLCKFFLHYVGPLIQRKGIASGTIDLWIKILGYLDRFMHTGRREQMYEAVVESLKNVLLVMNASGILKPPHEVEGRNDGHDRFWAATEQHIDVFQSGLLRTLFPRPPPAAFDGIPELQ